MQQNLSIVDRSARVFIATLLAITGFALGAWWLYIIAAIVLGTALVGWCGFYALFGWNTCKVKQVKK